jgi:hypothetical protein
MLNMDDDRKCAHPMCSCLSAPDSDYCSPYCEAAKETAELACQCGHAMCLAAAEEVA